ncbi:MAG TPA: serine/threonine-protein kinase [Polyangiaceae bacterium]|nr:serine/threonine-protein kinase [Polyangiaceae bacterium]
MNSPSVTGVREGEILAGKYRVDKVLGVGGMGVVVAAYHIDLDERVAIKFLLPEVLDHGEAVARFAREARSAVKIKSEHVAKVTDVGKLENGAPYMVMEFLEGSDLSQWLAQRGALPIEQAAEFMLQACEAIAEAHALGIVHRDLKPANLFVIRRPDGLLSVKVLDFGISKSASGPGSGSAGAMTKTSALMGSPLYMSPEQMQSSRDVDARTDIWALGVILYELLAGTQPFTADTMPELVLRVVTGPPAASLRMRRPDVPEGLERVILRCLEKDRGRRFESVGEFAAALLPYAPRRSKTSVERISGVLRSAGLSATALALPPSSDHEAKASGHTAASWGRTASPKGRSRWVVVAAAVGVVVAAAALGWRTLRAEAPPASAASAPLDDRAPAPSMPAATSTPEVQVAPAPVVAPAAPTATTPPPTVAVEPTSMPEPPATRSATGGRARPGRPAAAKPAPTTKPAAPAAAPPPPEPPRPAPPPRPAVESKPNIFDDRK